MGWVFKVLQGTISEAVSVYIYHYILKKYIFFKITLSGILMFFCPLILELWHTT